MPIQKNALNLHDITTPFNLTDMKRNNILPLLLAATLFAGCKIQNAPGAYLPAKGKVEVSDMQPEPEPKHLKSCPCPNPNPSKCSPK